MFPNLNAQTLRWLLDVTGLAFLLLACIFHSWLMDGMGVALLLMGEFILPPFSGFGILSALALLCARPVGKTYTEEQFAFDFKAHPPVTRRCVWAVTPEGRITNVRAWGDLH